VVAGEEALLAMAEATELVVVLVKTHKALLALVALEVVLEVQHLLLEQFISNAEVEVEVKVGLAVILDTLMTPLEAVVRLHIRLPVPE
jgi:hypothetical protein